MLKGKTASVFEAKEREEKLNALQQAKVDSTYGALGLGNPGISILNRLRSRRLEVIEENQRRITRLDSMISELESTHAEDLIRDAESLLWN
jgi:TRAP-type uncharacterized transport system substrate-binding protein